MQLPAPSSQLPAPSSQLHRFSAPAALTVASLAILLSGAGARAQGTVGAPVFVTHDHPTQEPKRRDFWADTKTPGDGRVYVFGTADVADTNPVTALFSDRAVAPSSTLIPFTQSAVRQIAVLQINNIVDQVNFPQRYLYGTTADPNALRATNGRGISVWRGGLLTNGDPDHADTRIAVCGETYDEVFPLSQAPGGNPLAGPNHPSGFLAIYNGDGDLLWTHHFFGTDPSRSNGDCAITDVSIRVETIDNELFDVVTYCGISTHGVPNSSGVPISNGALTPEKPFAAPFPVVSTTPPTSYAATSGSTDNGVGQWDGFIGRLRRRHDGSGSTITEFHAIVGGFPAVEREGQDGLFGIAEIDSKRFVVVGSTHNSEGFPFTRTAFDPSLVPNAVGVQMVFHFDGNTLELEDSIPIGNPGAVIIGTPGISLRTVARDVHVQIRHPLPNYVPPAGLAAPEVTINVVGSTNDPDIFTSVGVGATAVVGSLSGPSDGFLMVGVPPTVVSSSPVVVLFPGEFLVGAFHGDDLDDGLTGVSAWSEAVDHIVVAGFTRGKETGGLQDFEIGSYYLDQPAAGGIVLKRLRRAQVGGPSDIERPAAMALECATRASSGTLFLEFGLSDPAGGGVAVDPHGRVNVVGATDQGISPTPAVPPQIAGRAFAASAGGPREDGVRIVLDLLPPGVGRTDGTGDQTVLPTAYSLAEETTPRCPLSLFGNRIGTTAPVLGRMLIHYEGSDPAPLVTDAAIVVTRPPGSSTLMGTVLQLGFPDPTPTVLPDGLHVWLTSSPILFPSAGVGDRSFRFPLGLMPPGPVQFSAQLFCVLPAGIPGGSLPGPFPCNSTTALNAASPALFISY